jgi:hypothetical protein
MRTGLRPAARNASKSGLAGCICASVSRAVTSAAATTRRTVTRPHTFARQNTPSSRRARSAKRGLTATRTTSFSRRSDSRLRACHNSHGHAETSPAVADSVLAAGAAPASLSACRGSPPPTLRAPSRRLRARYTRAERADKLVGAMLCSEPTRVALYSLGRSANTRPR